MIHNMLFIERREKNARQLIRGTGGAGWGHSFEKAFTKLPEGTERSTQHHRVLRYALGELNCVVRFEVDACYENACEGGNQELHKGASNNVQQDLVLSIGKLSIGSSSRSNETLLRQTQTSSIDKQRKLMPQSTAAEIKTSSSYKSLGNFLPQLWFGRTPWLIMGHHAQGTFDNVKIINAGSEFAAWENKHQKELRKMVSLLSQLREAVKKSGSERCMAICEKRTRPRELLVFKASHQRGGLPDDVIGKFWRDENHS
jgi:hypothetical protein